MGKHKGTSFYTIGQRHGLGIAHKEPLYVTKIDITKNEITVGLKKDVFKKRLTAENLNWILYDKPPRHFKAAAKIRYKHKKAPAEISLLDGGRAKVEFDEPQEAPAPGQAVVFYEGDLVIGGGWIREVAL